ncbi:unnamed protein product [Prunus brigantina]
MITTPTIYIPHIIISSYTSISLIASIKHSWCRFYLSGILELLHWFVWFIWFLTIAVPYKMVKLVTVVALWLALKSTLTKMQFATVLAGISRAINGFVIFCLPILLILITLTSSRLI